MQTEDKMQTGGELGIFYKLPPSHSHVIVLVDILMGRCYFAGLKVTKRNQATVLLTLTLFQTLTLILTPTLFLT
jgi:hypothetical protein